MLPCCYCHEQSLIEQELCSELCAILWKVCEYRAELFVATVMQTTFVCSIFYRFVINTSYHPLPHCKEFMWMGGGVGGGMRGGNGAEYHPNTALHCLKSATLDTTVEHHIVMPCMTTNVF